MYPLDLAALRAAAVTREPFEFVVVPHFVPPACCEAINADYPAVTTTGSFPVGSHAHGPAFAQLLAALAGPQFRQAVEETFSVELAHLPTMTTVRAHSGARDGNIHTDAVTKVITVLIYVNPRWESSGGRLRLLRSAHDLNDVILEVPPAEGTLLMFKRSDKSWHGHLPHFGPRRVIQMNWVKGGWVRNRELIRHWISARLKPLTRLLHDPSAR
jgi:SM-20-related protein